MATWSGRTGSGRTFEVEVEQIPVSSYSSRPDPTWRWTDPHGHEHLALFLERTSKQYVEDVYWCDDCDEHHYDYVRLCKLCLAAGVDTEVVPGMLGPSPFVEFIPGMTTYKIDGQPVDEETFRHELEKEREAHG